MANEKISAMPAASALDGAELVPLVQSGGNVRATAQDVANLGFLQTVTVPISALELTTLHSAPVQIVAAVSRRLLFQWRLRSKQNQEPRCFRLGRMDQVTLVMVQTAHLLNIQCRWIFGGRWINIRLRTTGKLMQLANGV